jgi:ubiquinone/menaquinone biosynthesis C-methylase UbiE
MSFDANRYREASRQGWEEAAPGWRQHQALLRALGAPASSWMLDALALRPGLRVLELAAGMGETGMLASERVAPTGGVVISDQAEGMLEGARERAAALGLSNVEFQVFNAEWIDLPVASVDAILCRWGYMLMADPHAALADARRVLRPGGRIALAVWDALKHNPWALEPALELSERGLAPAPGDAGGAPGPFAMGSADIVSASLEQAGFEEIRVERLELARRHENFEEFWDVTLDLSRNFHDAVLARPEQEIAEIKASLAERIARYQDADGTVTLPGRTLLACASA